MNISELNQKILEALQDKGVVVKIYDPEGINPFNKDRVIVKLPGNTSCLAISPFKNFYAEFSIYDEDERFQSKIDDFSHAVFMKVIDDIENNTLSINLNIIPYIFFEAISKLFNKQVEIFPDRIIINNQSFSFINNPYREIIDCLLK